MLAFIGRTFISQVSYFGQVALLLRDTFVSFFVAPIRWKLVMVQIAEIGFRSQLVVAVTGAFTGAALSFALTSAARIAARA